MLLRNYLFFLAQCLLWVLLKSNAKSIARAHGVGTSCMRAIGWVILRDSLMIDDSRESSFDSLCHIIRIVIAYSFSFYSIFTFIISVFWTLYRIISCLFSRAFINMTLVSVVSIRVLLRRRSSEVREHPKLAVSGNAYPCILVSIDGLHSIDYHTETHRSRPQYLQWSIPKSRYNSMYYTILKSMLCTVHCRRHLQHYRPIAHAPCSWSKLHTQTFFFNLPCINVIPYHSHKLKWTIYSAFGYKFKFEWNVRWAFICLIINKSYHYRWILYARCPISYTL